MMYTKSACIGAILDGVPEHNWEKYYQLKEGDIFVEVGPLIGRYAVIVTKKRCRSCRFIVV